MEVKYYNPTYVQADIRKLLALERRLQRWMLVYRITPSQAPGAVGAPMQTLSDLMARYGRWDDIKTASFESVAEGQPGRCEAFLRRLFAAA